MKVRKYATKDKTAWNNFIKNSRSPHFMFLRDYMEYHSHKFEDFSLIFENNKNQILAVMPANLTLDNKIISHQGLTFGGLILGKKTLANQILEIFLILKEFCKKHGANRLIYKAIPHIYFEYPSEEPLYALFKNQAKLVRRDVSSTIYLDKPKTYSKGRKWSVKKAKKAKILVNQSNCWKQFWEILKETLRKRHGQTPVHSCEEIIYLANLFPENIKLFTASKEGEMVAGTVIFENKINSHTQYMANSEQGRNYCALDLLIDQLIEKYSSKKKFFDFGISTLNDGQDLNLGLISQKEGFGARAITHDFYELEFI